MPAPATPSAVRPQLFGHHADYETLLTLGEGSYGVVVKARHKSTGRVVAIKRFRDLDSEDKYVRKTALREVRLLKDLLHVNIVELLEVYRHKNKLNLVFEFCDRTLVDNLGMDANQTRLVGWQVLRAVRHLHAHCYVHRDISPKNVLLSAAGVVKLCDFGFARPLDRTEAYTEYVGQRWYRAPELLVKAAYSAPVDVWAIGVMLPEVYSGHAVFPGKSDVDQLYRIIACFGPPPLGPMGSVAGPITAAFERHHMVLPQTHTPLARQKRFRSCPAPLLHVLTNCLLYDPSKRATCAQLLEMPYFAEVGSVPDDEVPSLLLERGADGRRGMRSGGLGGNGSSRSHGKSQACTLL